MLVGPQPDNLFPSWFHSFQKQLQQVCRIASGKGCQYLQHSFPIAGWFSGPASFCKSSLSQLLLPQSDSYDFLSAEEKECLLFLEETIGSLDTEADSGLSTDESEPATTPRGFQALPITQLAPHGKTDYLGNNTQKIRVSFCLLSTPALCSNGHRQKKELCTLLAGIKLVSGGEEGPLANQLPMSF